MWQCKTLEHLVKMKNLNWNNLDKFGLIFIYLFSITVLSYGVIGLVVGHDNDLRVVDELLLIFGGALGCVLSGMRYLERFAKD